MGPWKEVCSCTSSGSLCLRGTFSVHQSGLCLPSPVPWSLATGLAEVPLIALLQSFSCVLHSEKGRARLVSNLSLSNAHGSWGVPAAVYFILAWLYRDVPAGPWRGALASSRSGNPGTCGTAAAEAEASMGVSSVSGLMRTPMDVGGCSVWLGINGFRHQLSPELTF